MSTWPIVQFVDAPSPDANVRYDFNDADATAPRRVADDFTLGVPTLEGDPDAVGQAWGFRSPSFTQRVKGPKAAALAALGSLSRELLRPTNWVHFKLDQFTPSVWLRTYRTGGQPLSLARVRVDTATGDSVPDDQCDTWEIQVPLVADAFGYGERVDLDPVTVTQSPDGSHPMRIVLPAIKGDAPTPLRVTLTPDGASGVAGLGSGWLLGCLNGTSDMADPVIDIGTGDGFTAGTGTSGPATDSDHFGGSYRTITISSADPLDTVRLTGTMPTLPLGRYKVMLHGDADRDSDVRLDQTYLFRLKVNASLTGPEYVGPATPVTCGPSGTFSGWIDLGEFSYPPGVASLDHAPPGQEPPAAGAGVFYLQGTTADGSSSTFRIDALKFIPVSGPTISRATLLDTVFPGLYYPHHDSSSLPAATGTWDGDTESYWTTAVAPTTNTGVLPSSPQMRGGYPVADPGAEENVLLVMAIDAGSSTVSYHTDSHLIASTGAEVQVDLSYQPWLLHLPGEA